MALFNKAPLKTSLGNRRRRATGPTNIKRTPAATALATGSGRVGGGFGSAAAALGSAFSSSSPKRARGKGPKKIAKRARALSRRRGK